MPLSYLYVHYSFSFLLNSCHSTPSITIFRCSSFFFASLLELSVPHLCCPFFVLSFSRCSPLPFNLRILYSFIETEFDFLVRVRHCANNTAIQQSTWQTGCRHRWSPSAWLSSVFLWLGKLLWVDRGTWRGILSGLRGWTSSSLLIWFYLLWAGQESYQGL